MKTITLAGKRIELYESIEELPIVRFHKYNKMLLVDAGCGSDLSDFDKHIEKAIQYAKSKTPALAVTELENLRQNVYFVQQNISPKLLSFAVLVKSVNDMSCDDISDEGLKKTCELLQDITVKDFAAAFAAVKKKIDDELQTYFPSLFDDARLKEYYDILKQRTILILKTIIDGQATEKEEKEIKDITSELITYFHPQTFAGNKSVEIAHDKQFEKMCLILSENLHVSPKKMTTLEYYNAFEYINELAKKQKKKPA